MHLNSQIFSLPRQSLSVSPPSVSLTLSPVDRGSLLGLSKSVRLSLRVAALSDSRHRSLSPPHQLRYTLWTSLKFYVFFKKSDFEARIWRIGARFIFAWPLWFFMSCWGDVWEEYGVGELSPPLSPATNRDCLSPPSVPLPLSPLDRRCMNLYLVLL